MSVLLYKKSSFAKCPNLCPRFPESFIVCASAIPVFFLAYHTQTHLGETEKEGEREKRTGHKPNHKRKERKKNTLQKKIKLK